MDGQMDGRVQFVLGAQKTQLTLPVPQSDTKVMLYVKFFRGHGICIPTVPQVAVSFW